MSSANFLKKLPQRFKYLGVKIFAQIAVIALIIVGSIALFQALMASKPEPIKKTARERVWTIKTVPAERKNITPHFLLYGETIARKTVDLRSFVGGQIIAVSPRLNAGQVIEKGEALVEIDKFDYEGALIEAGAQVKEAEASLQEIRAQIDTERSGLAFAENQLTLAIRDLERIENLRERGSSTDKAVDERRLLVSQRQESLTQKQSNFAVLNAREDQRKAQLERLNWQLEKAKRNVNDTVLRAPFEAVVTAKNVEVGKLVNVNDIIASLQEMGSIDVKFTLPNRYFGRMTAKGENIVGRKVQLTWRVGGEPLTYDAEISRIGATITAASGGVELFASVTPNMDKPPLRPGAFVELKIPDITYKNIVSVPQTAVYDNSHIFIVVDERLEQKQVDVVGTDGTNILINSPLKPTDLIKITRLPQAGNGVKVRTANDRPANKAQSKNKEGKARSKNRQAPKAKNSNAN